MKTATFWGLTIFMWAIACVFAYVGLILVFLGPWATSRGDIDFVDFSEADKRAAEIQAALVSLSGFIPLGISGTILYYSKRIVRRVLGIEVPKENAA